MGSHTHTQSSRVFDNMGGGDLWRWMREDADMNFYSKKKKTVPVCVAIGNRYPSSI